MVLRKLTWETSTDTSWNAKVPSSTIWLNSWLRYCDAATCISTANLVNLILCVSSRRSCDTVSSFKSKEELMLNLRSLSSFFCLHFFFFSTILNASRCLLHWVPTQFPNQWTRSLSSIRRGTFNQLKMNTKTWSSSIQDCPIEMYWNIVQKTESLRISRSFERTLLCGWTFIFFSFGYLWLV